MHWGAAMNYSEILEQLKKISKEFEALYPITKHCECEHDVINELLSDLKLDVELYIKNNTNIALNGYLDGVKIGFNDCLTAKEINDLELLAESW